MTTSETPTSSSTPAYPPGLPESRPLELPDHIELREILVAVDGSPHGRVALDWAITVASERGAGITLMHVIPSTTITSLPLDMQTKIESDLRGLEERVRAVDVRVGSRYDVGTPWECVIDAAGEVNAQLIVIGARGRTAFSGLRLGSTADRVIRASTVPVLTVPPIERGRHHPVRTIVAATDFSDCSRRALVEALRLMPHTVDEAKIVIVHAWQPLVEYSFGAAEVIAVDPLDETDEQVRDALDRLAEPLRERGYDVHTVSRQGYPAGVIEREAKSVDADLIVLGTHGRTGFHRLLLGSIAERVLHLAGCPVLTVRESG
jgi:nucleotide-binding universal stress UspA family protein